MWACYTDVVKKLWKFQSEFGSEKVIIGKSVSILFFVIKLSVNCDLIFLELLNYYHNQTCLKGPVKWHKKNTFESSWLLNIGQFTVVMNFWDQKNIVL